jgi:hypothetical protein
MLSSQRKSLLLIDGPVKSGKTTLAKELIPFLLDDVGNLLKEDYCYAYLDLSILAGRSSLQEKWFTINELFKDKFGEIWVDVNPGILDFHLKVRASLRTLNQAVNRWIIALDEYHFLFNKLSENDMETMAEQMKLVLLDNESRCHYILAGSTQATFWWSIHKARPNGLNMMTGATLLTTSFVSSKQEIDLCCEVLEKKENAQKQNLIDILDLLDLQNVVFLSQVSFL